MMKLKKTIVGLAAAALFGAASVANAAILIDDWRIDIGSIGNDAATDDFTGFGVFGTRGANNGIEDLTFTSLFHSIIAGPLAFGTRQHTDVLGNVTSATGSASIQIRTTNGQVLGDDFEITFVSTTTQMLLGAPVNGAVGTTHLASGSGPNGFEQNGFLSIYVDRIDGAAGDRVGVQANSSFSTGGAGMMDGFLLARFEVLSAGGVQTGVFNVQSLDGADDATFRMVFNSGAVLDAGGNPLPIGSVLGFIDSNTDADPDSNNTLDTVPTGWPGGGLGNCVTNNVLDTCGREDGSFVLQQGMPEPSSLALFGIALAGLGVLRRRSLKA